MTYSSVHTGSLPPVHEKVLVALSIALVMMESLMSCTGAAEDMDQEQVGRAEEWEQQASSNR